MQKILILLVTASVLFTSCGEHFQTHSKGDATQMLEDILSRFSGEEGFVFSDRRDAECPLTSAFLARMFPDEGDTEDLFCVISAAVYVSKRFSEQEIVVFQLCDLSHREKIISLLQKRAKKKENAIVVSDGVYIYLLCTGYNEEIREYLEP